MKLIVRHYQLPLSYLPTWQRMIQHVQKATKDTPDELWLMEHEPVFTQGQAGKSEHILNPHDIPIVHTDRGGQITYHGPGQLMLYSLLNLGRLNIGTRTLVRQLEQVIIDYLATLGISAECKEEAPGIYVNGHKIASIGLRVSRGFCYHGMAFNIHMDLTPFTWINPCGYKDQVMTQLTQYCPGITMEQVKLAILPLFMKQFGYCDQVKV